MPGIFGAVACPPSCWSTLFGRFSAIWGEVDSSEESWGAIGGHAFRPSRAVHKTEGGRAFAVDGQASVYSMAGGHAENSVDSLFRMESGSLVLSEDCAGNVAVLDPSSRSLFLAANVCGSFPLYYFQMPGGVMFSSLLRPLVEAMAALSIAGEPDMVGVVQWLRRGCYFFGNRTFYSGVKKLLPGQVLRFGTDTGELMVRETSDVFAGGYEHRARTLNGAADMCWETLIEATGRSLAEHPRNALMMSAGWDSRVLFAAQRAAFGREKVLCYSHGDLASRELDLVRRICAQTGVRFRLESTEGAYDPTDFDATFARVESLVFPHWQRAGRVLSGMGVRDIHAGVYGAIIGGEQGPDSLEAGYRKIPASLKARVVGTLGNSHRRGLQVDTLRRAFFVHELSRPWYLLQSAWEAMPPAHGSINADIESDLQRLVGRGIENQDQLLEAVLVETIQAQYEIDQVLSCRASTDVSIPYGDHRLLRLASRIPWVLKYHRTLMRRMLRRYAPDLLSFPMSATLVPARAPFAAQQMSRLVRRFLEQNRWRLHHASSGVIPYPRYGWWWFEFLKDGSLMHALVEDLRCDFWDRPAIHARIMENTAMGPRLDFRSSTADVLGHVLRISTVDRMLR